MSRMGEQSAANSMEFAIGAGSSAPRADRVARLIVGFLSATADAHSVDDLCVAGLVGVAPSTFRRWCRAEGVRPNRILDFARLLRALTLAREHGTSLLEWMEMDPRTFTGLLRRAEVRELSNGRLPTPQEFTENQRLVSNPVLLKAVQYLCFGRGPAAHATPASTLQGPRVSGSGFGAAPVLRGRDEARHSPRR